MATANLILNLRAAAGPALRELRRAFDRARFYALMPAICAWLDANGIPPGRVPLAEVPRVDRTRRTIRLFVIDQHSRRWDHRHGRPAGRRTAVYLAVRPPAELRDWLAGKVRP